MPREFTLSVVAPDKLIAEEKVTGIVAPGSEGYFGVLADHVATIASLRPGLLEYVDATNQRHYVYVGGGFLEVRDNFVSVLADEAERTKDIDLSKAEAMLETARRALRGESSELTTQEAAQELERSMNRLKAARTAR